MGLADDLDYRIRPANPAQRLVQSFASSKPGAWLFSKVLRHLDTLLGGLSRGRVSAPGLLAGLPVLDVTTTGRRSGQLRTSHLIAVPVADTLALLGTNFGQPGTPAWVHNLESDPRVRLSYRGRMLRAVARPASEAEYDEVMRAADGVYGGYRRYRERITGRRLRIFVLSPA